MNKFGNIRFRLLVFCLAGMCLGCLPVAVSAASMEEIAHDFEPLEGYVIQLAGDDVIIDLDRSQGIDAGDIFGVLGPGKKIVHPVTQKVVGTLETVKRFIQVTRIMEGYAFAKPLTDLKTIKIGDPIRRFEGIAAYFWDYTDQGRTLSGRLARLLPHLDWRDYADAQRTRPAAAGTAPKDAQTALYFIYRNRSLEVRGPDFLTLHIYDIASAGVSGKTKAGAPAALAAVPMKPEKEATPQAATPDSPPGVRYSAVFEGSQTVGNISGVTLMADFIRVQNQTIMARTNGSRIFVDLVGQELKPLAVADTPVPSPILSLKWWAPFGPDPLYLAVTTWLDKKVNSLIYRYDAGSLHPLDLATNRILGTFDLDGDGWPETLLGQRLDREVFFGRSIRKITLDEERLQYQRPPLTLPPRFTVLGSAIADLNDDGRQEAAFIRTGILYIYNGKDRLYASPKEMGGSLAHITYDVDPLAKDVRTVSAFMEVSPFPVDLEGDGRLELIAVSSDRPFVTSPGMGLRPKREQLAVIKYTDGRFIKGTLGDPTDLSIQGLTVADGRALLVVSEPESILWGKDKNSHVLKYPLAQR